MAGRGALDRVSHGTAEAAPDHRVISWTSHRTWRPAADPLHWDKPAAGVGPGLTCALVLLRLRVCDSVRLIPAAVGGSSIEMWRPGALFAELSVRPYDDALTRCREALDGAPPDAILWHQGESDTNEAGAAAYAARLEKLVARMRTDFDRPTLPVVAGTLGDFLTATNPWANVVNDALRTLPEHVRHTAFVDARGLSDVGDGLHFDASSARELGQRYGVALASLFP